MHRGVSGRRERAEPVLVSRGWVAVVRITITSGRDGYADALGLNIPLKSRGVD